MKNKLFLLAFTLLALQSFGQIKLPTASPREVIKQEFGLGTIELSYGRPSVKSRTIFGDLVPYGTLWRTGANPATTVSFTNAVEIGGKRIAAGSYALYTVPGEEDWVIVLNKGVNNWGTEKYTDKDDVLRFNVKPGNIKNREETFAIQFVNVTPATCDLQMTWDRTQVSFRINSLVQETLGAKIDSALATDKKPWWEATQFYYEYAKNNPKALDAANHAVLAAPKSYFIWLYKAKIENEVGDKTAAIASAQHALDLAQAAGNDEYVKMSRALLKKFQ